MNQFINITNPDAFISKVKEMPDFKLIVSELMADKKITSENFVLEKARKLENSEFNISYLTLVQNNIKIVFTDDGTKNKFIVRIIENNDGVEMAYLYEILDDILILTHKTQYKHLLDDLKELDEKTIPETFNKDEVKANVPCIHGNWCGPGCSGPDSPVDAVDSCCKAHDLCYDSLGYSSCSCDRRLKKCLKPYVASGSEWAIAVTTAFNIWPCKEFAY